VHARADDDDPRVARCAQPLEQQVRQQEVAEVVDAERELMAGIGPPQAIGL
jgi:hypothetical protein